MSAGHGNAAPPLTRSRLSRAPNARGAHIGMRSLTSACSSAAFARFGLLASVTVLCGCNEVAERLYKEELRLEYAEVLRVQPALG